MIEESEGADNDGVAHQHHTQVTATGQTIWVFHDGTWPRELRVHDRLLVNSTCAAAVPLSRNSKNFGLYRPSSSVFETHL